MESNDAFSARHIGPDDAEIRDMLKAVGTSDLETLIARTVPASIRTPNPLDIPAVADEAAFLRLARKISGENQTWRSCIGAGYYGCVVPPVIQRNVLENPGWYTAYTPYQAEISQGRMEALLNFKQMVMDLTALDVSQPASELTYAQHFHEPRFRPSLVMRIRYDGGIYGRKVKRGFYDYTAA